jgi:co-chaperonin GroES (HSP10)
MKQEVPIKSTEFQPKATHILVKAVELEKEKTTESGLIISINQSSMARPTVGEVLEVGCDVKDVKKGTIVLWPQTDGIDLEFDDGEFVLLRYESIIGSKK